MGRGPGKEKRERKRELKTVLAKESREGAGGGILTRKEEEKRRKEEKAKYIYQERDIYTIHPADDAGGLG